MNKNKTVALFVLLAICYAVAIVAGIITRPEIPTWYASLIKPPWRPPNWLFGPVWTLLYGMMAFSAWKVWCTPSSRLRSAALWIFAAQLTLNFLWSPVFFSLHRVALGFAIISALAVLLLSFILLTWKFQRTAAWLFIPYLAWISFAAFLNYSIWKMNS